MGIRLSELEAETPITLLVSNEDNEMRIDGYIKKVINDAVAIIGIDFESPQRLNFENVKDLSCVIFYLKNVLFYFGYFFLLCLKFLHFGFYLT